MAAAALLFAAELATLSYRTIGIGGCESRVNPAVCSTSGGDAHSHVLWLVALAVLVFAFGAAIGRSRPAALALIGCGVAVLVIALALDLPDLGDTRGLEAMYTHVAANTGAGFFIEIAGGVLALAAGLAGLMRRRERAAGSGRRAVPQTVEERAEERRRVRESGSA